MARCMAIRTATALAGSPLTNFQRAAAESHLRHSYPLGLVRLMGTLMLVNSIPAVSL
jgi:hypothetical protein